VTVPILIIFTFIGIIHDSLFRDQALASSHSVTPALSPFYQYQQVLLNMIHPHIETFTIAKILLFLIVVSGVLKLVFARIRREFWLYYARGCFVQMQNSENEMEEMRYFVMGLNSFNLYIRRQLKLEINNLNQAYSKIASFDNLKKNDVIGKFALFFSSDKMVEFSTLIPLREISKLLDTSEKELLIGQSLKNRIMEWGAAAAVFIPLAIQTITYINESAFLRSIFH
jgi:hypothetical protein